MKIILFAAAIILLVSACGQNQGQKEETADTKKAVTTEVKAEEPVAEQPVEAVKHEYLSQDLATFDLYGKVESVNYDKGEHTLPVCVQFDTNGKVTSIVRTDSGGNKENAQILYDGSDKIETILFESDDPWINVLTYRDGEGFQAPITYTTTNQMGNYTEVTYQRDSSGIVTGIQREESIHFALVEDNDPYTIELSDFDRMGNWLLCTKKWGEYTFVIKRTISYYQQD
ncbi:MAG: hypothetical protein IKX26_01975 [Bacteroidales bacterium]|nr:hypothetical protein [Bacteroidales bacterium]